MNVRNYHRHVEFVELKRACLIDSPASQGARCHPQPLPFAAVSHEAGETSSTIRLLRLFMTRSLAHDGPSATKQIPALSEG